MLSGAFPQQIPRLEEIANLVHEWSIGLNQQVVDSGASELPVDLELATAEEDATIFRVMRLSR